MSVLRSATAVKVAVSLGLLGMSLALSGCYEDATAQAGPPATPPEVGVVTVKAEPLSLTRELPGRVAPTRVADVRPRVSGIVVQRLFEQGSDVKAGDALYQIDPKPFEVELQAAEAELQRARAGLELAQQQVQRSLALSKVQAVSTSQHEIVVATVAQARAEVAAREAQVARARLNLDYATVRAPIGGTIGAARATEGALVVQNDTANLATIQALDTIYADFTQSVAELNRLRRAFESGDLERPDAGTVKVKLVLDDGRPYAHTGKLLFSDARVEPSSGQVTLRGEFANPGRELLPGMYVRVVIDQGVDSDAIAIPEQAVQRNGGGGSEVFVVKEDGRTALQPVRLSAAQDGRWLVAEGLKPGDRVVVDGFQKFAAGDQVTAQAVADAAEAPGGTGRTREARR
jgi:membrane fusion protein (multidrug efflux system)